MSRRAVKRMAVVGVLLTLQVLAFLLYRQIEARRGTASDAPFQVERLEARPLAPELLLEQLDGATLRLSERQGHWVLVHFWATWCPPCREELPELLALDSAPVADRKLALLAVAVNEPWEPIQHFFGGKPPAPIVRDPSGTAHRRYDVETLPASFLVAPDGRIVARIDGPRAWRSEAARQMLEQEGHTWERLRGAPQRP